MTVTYTKGSQHASFGVALCWYHKWMSLCHSGSLWKREGRIYERIQADLNDLRCLPGRHGRSSRGLHTLAIFSTFRDWDGSWHLKPVQVAPGLQTSPQHVPLPRVLRPHREGHTFWHHTNRTQWSYFGPVTVCTQHSESAQASQFSPKNSKHHTTVSKPFPTWIYCCLHLYLRSVTLGREGAYNLCSGAISEIRARKSRLSPRCTVLAEPVKVSKGPIRLNMFFSKETFDMVAKDD